MAKRPVITRDILNTFRNNREMHRFLLDLYGQSSDVSDLLNRITTYTLVSNLANPTELNSLEGKTDGALLVAYTTGGEYTFYNYSSASLAASAPYVMAGSSGFWVASAGKYINSELNVSTINTDFLNGVQYIDFDTTATPTHQYGRLHIDDEAGTLELGLKGGTVKLSVGQELLTPRAKAIGSDILDGQAVYVSGGVGSSPIPEMTLAKADALATSCSTIALATEDVTQNTLGFFVSMGIARGLDTSAWAAGTELFLSAATAGVLTSTEPTSPNYSVSVGIVVRSNATDGAIFVNIRLLMAKFSRIYGMTGTYIPFADANGFLTESINLVFSNNNLGVAQSTPTARIHIGAGTAAANTGPLKFTSGTALTTPETGCVEFHNDRMYITNVSSRRAIDRSSDVLLSTVTVTNTTTETTVLTDNIGANGLKVGNFAKLIASGDITNASAADIVTVRVKIDGSTVATIASPGVVLSNDCFHIGGHTTIRSVGGTGDIQYHIDIDINGTSSDSCGNQTIDTTGANAITITAQWNNAKAGNVFNLTQAILEFKN